MSIIANLLYVKIQSSKKIEGNLSSLLQQNAFLLGEVLRVVSLPVVLECGLPHPPEGQGGVIVLPPRDRGGDQAAPQQGLGPPGYQWSGVIM